MQSWLKFLFLTLSLINYFSWQLLNVEKIQIQFRVSSEQTAVKIPFSQLQNLIHSHPQSFCNSNLTNLCEPRPDGCTRNFLQTSTPKKLKHFSVWNLEYFSKTPSYELSRAFPPFLQKPFSPLQLICHISATLLLIEKQKQLLVSGVPEKLSMRCYAKKFFSPFFHSPSFLGWVINFPFSMNATEKNWKRLKWRERGTCNWTNCCLFHYVLPQQRGDIHEKNAKKFRNF